jgi:hypothetical protein
MLSGKKQLKNLPFYFIVLSGFTGQAGNGLIQGIQGASRQLPGGMLFVPAQAFNKSRLLISKTEKYIFFI